MTTTKKATVTKTRTSGVFKRVGPRGTTYQAVFRDDDGKQKWVTKDTYEEAKAAKQDAEVSVRNHEYVDTGDRVTVAAYARQYVDSRAHEQRPATRARQLSIVGTHLDGTQLGALPLVKVRREHIDLWLAERGGIVKRSTLRTMASLLRSTFAYAVENKRLRTRPAVVVTCKRRTVDEGRVYAPTVEEVRALAEAMPTPTTRAMVLVQAGTGLRISELLALRTCDVSTTFRTMNVVAQLSRTGERVPTKTPESERTVPVSDAVAAVIAQLVTDGAEPDALLFSSADRPIRQNSYHVTFKRAVESAGLPATLSSHDLRHHFATTLLRRGLSPVAVGRLLGHTDGSLVVRTYAHWMPEDDDLARAALDAEWGDEQAAPALRVAR